MLDLDSLRHRPPAPAPAPERATKATSGDYTITPRPWGEEWEPTVPVERAAKLAKGAKSVEEHKVLTALREKPATSTTDLANRTGLNETAAMLAFRALQSRNLTREVSSGFGLTSTMMAID